MKFRIKHEIKGRMRVHMAQKRMSYEQADTLLYYLQTIPGVESANVYDRTADAAIRYSCPREVVIQALRSFHYDEVETPEGVIENSGRELNSRYQEKLINKILFHYGRKFLLPAPIRACYTTVMSAKYIWKGVKTLWRRKIEVPVLDATAIGVSVFRGDYRHRRFHHVSFRNWRASGRVDT